MPDVGEPFIPFRGSPRDQDKRSMNRRVPCNRDNGYQDCIKCLFFVAPRKGSAVVSFELESFDIETAAILFFQYF